MSYADLKARADALIEEYRGDKVADVVAGLGWEIARLREALAAERERCARIAEEERGDLSAYARLEGKISNPTRIAEICERAVKQRIAAAIRSGTSQE